MPDIITPPSEPTPAPAAPAPETVPVTPPSPSPTTKSWTDALDALPDIDDAPAVKPEPAKAAPEKPKDEAKPADTTPAKPAEKPDAKPDVKQDQDGLPAFRTNQELRKWAKERNAAAAAAESKRVELENKLKELETRVPKTEQGAELLAQQLADAQKRLEQHEQLIEVQSFEHSQKYQKEYAAPYHAARQKAYKDVAEMMVNEPTDLLDDEGNPKMRQRAATQADFDRIYSLPRAQARELAKKMFGDDDAAEIMAHRRNISELAEKAQAALDDRRKNFGTYKQQEMAQRSQQEIAIQGLWKTANEKISQDPKRAVYWGEDKEDPEANKALAGGFKLADEFFSEKRDQMSPQDRVEFDAYIRHTIAMGPRLAYKLNKFMAECKALKEEIAQIRGSAPGAPAPISDEQPVKKPDSMDSAIDAM